MATLFSRVMYCEECAKQHNPQHGQKFVVHGRSKRAHLTILQVSSPHKEGYTPHLIQMITSHAGIVHFTKICGINGCGIKLHQDGDSWKVSYENVKDDRMTVKEWNALIMFKGDTGYQLDE